MSQEQFRDLLLSEYAYWRDTQRQGGEVRDLDLCALGAMGAVANVLAAVMGHPAPWHPSEKTTTPAVEENRP